MCPDLFNSMSYCSLISEQYVLFLLSGMSSIPMLLTLHNKIFSLLKLQSHFLHEIKIAPQMDVASLCSLTTSFDLPIAMNRFSLKCVYLSIHLSFHKHFRFLEKKLWLIVLSLCYDKHRYELSFVGPNVYAIA